MKNGSTLLLAIICAVAVAGLAIALTDWFLDADRGAWRPWLSVGSVAAILICAVILYRRYQS